jgi:uncharacterized protein (DUF305 family)
MSACARRVKMLRAGPAIALMLGVVSLGACGSGSSKPTDAGADSPADRAFDTGMESGGGDDASTATFTGDRRVPFTPADDVQFVDFFVPHHEAAIDMATMELAHGSDAAVKAMAQQMKTSQMDEIAMMRSARQALTGVADSPPPPADAHMAADMHVMMGLSGAQLDKVFLEEMIQHHAAALPAAHRAPPNLSRSDLKALASSIYDAQSREIGEMKMMLGDPTGGAAAQAGVADGGVAQDGGYSGVDVSPTGDRRIPYTPADDVAFIDFFVPHHQSAIEMATMVIDRGARAEVKALAQSIKNAQTAEITMMRAARQALTGQPDSPAPPADPHMDADMMAMMGLSGAALDMRFLMEMIPHHAAGLPPAHRGRPNLQRSDLRQLALDIFAAQSREIGEMHDMLALGADGGVTDAASGH